METLLPWLVAAAALATLGVLAAGVVNMFRGAHSARSSNVLMRWRIALQAAAIALLVLFLLLSQA